MAKGCKVARAITGPIHTPSPPPHPPAGLDAIGRSDILPRPQLPRP
jgi:hypothetical protein